MSETTVTTLWGLVCDVEARFGTRTAVYIPDPPKTVTYTQLAHAVKTLKAELFSAGVRKGDVISLILPNGYSFLVAFFAVTSLGAVAAPLNMAYKSDDFTFYLKDTETKAVLIPADLSAEHEGVTSAKALGLKVWKLSEKASDPTVTIELDSPLECKSDAGALESTQTPAPDSAALFLHTSGTTSLPKGVPLTHLNLLTSIRNIANTLTSMRSRYELSPDDVSLIVMPLFHVHGLLGATLSTLSTGGGVVVPVKFSATVFWKYVREYKVTWYSAVPTIHQILLLREDELAPKPGEKLLRFIRSCSSSLAPVQFDQLVSRFNAPVLEAYGMTEASHQMASNPLPHHGPAKVNSVGKGTNVEISIRDPDADQALPPNEKGEVCIRGLNVTKGYHNRPEANATSFTPSGWFRTGDQGYLDSDGYLFLTGRIKELINRGGEKISPLELDAVLLAHPGVADAVAFAAPHEVYGEQVACAVVPKPDVTLTVQDIVDHCKAKVAAFKVPTKVFIASEFPRTATGKIQRRHVAAHFLKQEEKK